MVLARNKAVMEALELMRKREAEAYEADMKRLGLDPRKECKCTAWMHNRHACSCRCIYCRPDGQCHTPGAKLGE